VDLMAGVAFHGQPLLGLMRRIGGPARAGGKHPDEADHD